MLCVSEAALGDNLGAGPIAGSILNDPQAEVADFVNPNILRGIDLPGLIFDSVFGERSTAFGTNSIVHIV